MYIQSPLMKTLDGWNFSPGLMRIGNRKAMSCGRNEKRVTEGQELIYEASWIRKLGVWAAF